VALKTPPHKVIVLDCDNTLWKGICGEDGTMGVRIEGPYKELQQFMLKKLDEGMLLALCSKNNEADVWEVFEQNPGMLLKKDHLVGWKINWNPKPGNLQELAAELNLGIDSFIFVDDNPMECSQMMEHCPNVLTLQLPEDPGEIPMFLKHIWAFDRLKVTAEDKKRTRMYITERKRREVKSSISSLDAFIKNLQLKVVMGRIEPSRMPRAAQLTRRTNQFNLSTLRRTESELGELLKSPGIDARVVHVSDRFGDYGLVGVVITKEQGDHLFIDTFLLSCRVLGRTVENAILAGLKNDCKEKNINALHAKFIPTRKNKPFLEFLEKTNWEKIEETDAHTLYKLSPDQIPEIPGYVDLTFTGGTDEHRDHEAAVEEREALLEKLHQVNELYVFPHRSNLEAYSEYSAFIDELLGALLRYSKINNDSLDYIVKAYNEYYLGFSKLQEEFQKSGRYRFASYSELESALNPTFYKDYIYILLLSYITTYYRFEMKRFIDEAFEKYLSNGTETGLEVGFGTGIDLVERLKYFRAYDVFDTNRFSKSVFDVLFSTNGKLRFHHSFFNFDKEEEYSCVQLIELLEHLEDPGAYIEGAYKVLKPGGVLIFTAAVNMANIDHIHLFNSYKEVEALIDPARWDLLDKKHCINSMFKYSEQESKEIIEEKSSPYISVYVARKR
jgi:FkbH-like protein